jgi:hypothetical protein
MLLLLGMIALRQERLADLKPLACTVALALMANAFVCGALSNPHDRYGARMVWLAVLVILLAPWHATSRSGSNATPGQIRGSDPI